MKQSKINLYYKSLIQEDKNFIIDDGAANSIQDYLDTLDSVTMTRMQYVKHALVVSIKIDAYQDWLEMGVASNDINYCSITNYVEDEDHEITYERTMYYFIVNKTWKSQSTIELVLHMDTLNTFDMNGDFVVSPKTLIHRMHKDRFEKIGNREFILDFKVPAGYTVTQDFRDLIISKANGTIISAEFMGTYSVDLSIYNCNFGYNSTYGYYYIRTQVKNVGNDDQTCRVKVVYKTNAIKRIIDFKSEEISAPLYKRTEKMLFDKIEKSTEWSLYYKNSDNQIDTSPVDCYLIPNAPMQINYMATAGTIDHNNLPSGKWAYFCPRFPDQPLTFKQGDNLLTPELSSLGEETYTKSVVIHNNSGTIEMYLLNADYVFLSAPLMDSQANYVKIGDGDVEVLNPPTSLHCHIENSQIPASSSDTLFDLATSSNATDTLAMGSMTQTTMMDLATIDKTLSENIKIIHVPYSPTPYSRNNNVYEFAQCWTYNTTDKMLKLTDFSYRWKNNIETNDVSDILSNFIYSTAIATTQTRNIKDSKLYHSDYYMIKFVYDSFGKGFNLENIDFWESYSKTNGSEYFAFEFIMSRNLVSKFLFKFTYVYKYSIEDYDNVVAVARNNEEVLYSSQYLNYVRTGYNYDIKAKQRQEQALGASLALSGGSSLISTLVGLGTGNPLAITGGIISGLSFSGQIINYAKTSAQAEENIERKLEETKRQAVSVLNADDYDLMYEYAQNKPKLCYYKVSDRMEDVLDDLFYYCGYKLEQQMSPTRHTRAWFDFLQCDLVIVDTDNLTSEVESDIKEKFSQGVTFFHDINGDWDLSQEKENWEISLL